MMTGRWILGVAVAAVAAQGYAFDVKELDARVERLFKGDRAPSMVVAISVGGKTVYEKALGYASLDWSIKATPDTVYEIGSVTKQFTATLIMKLVEEGKVKLDDRISTYIANTPEVWKDVTVRHCLTHTSGIEDYLGLGFSPRKDYTNEGLLDIVRKQKMSFPPGDSWSYTNSGFLICGMIAEKVTGKKYATLLNEMIFTPLGMTHTRTISQTDIIPKRAVGYRVDPKQNFLAEPLREASGGPAGNIISTVGDMLKWSNAWLTGRILKPESIEQCWKPVELNWHRPYDYGFGWFVHVDPKATAIEHGGNTFGQSAEHYLVPSKKLAIVIMTNKYGGNYVRAAADLASIVFPELKPDKIVVSPDPKPELARRIRDTMNRVMVNKEQPDDLAPELRARLYTARGRATAPGLKSQFGRFLNLKYVSTQPREGFETRTYVVVSDQLRVTMSFEVLPDGALRDFHVVGPAP